MRLSKRKHAAPLSISMTPMIDIVFLLIIFFMTLPQLTKVVYHPVELPIVQKIQNDQGERQLTINIDREGKILIDGHALDLPSLDVRLEELLRENNNDPDRIQVLLRADGRVATGSVNELMKLFDEKNIKQVRVSARSNQ